MGHFAEDSVADMTDKLFNGYDRGLEYDADQAAIEIMSRLGYNPQGLKNVLLVLAERTQDRKEGFGKTHPKPADRIKRIEENLRGLGPVQSPPERQARFDAAMKGL